MKNKYDKSESVFKKRGFYVALYSCVGVVLVLAATISFSSLNSVKKDDEPQTQTVDERPVEEVGKSSDPSYLTQQDKRIAQQNKSAAQQPEEWLGVSLGDTSGILGDNISTEMEVQTPPNSESTAATAEKTEPSAASAVTPAAPVEDTVSQSQAQLQQEESISQDYAVSLAEPVFKPFTAEYAMSWPVLGEVVMDFSNERAIYDKTLEQYRTNDNICIEAQVGTQVKASMEGVIKTVTNTRENGNMVVIDHGNGWETIYSQLQDNILVKEGDVVKTGQVIGGVANPSIYSVLLGNHLAFQVSRDDVIIDPKTILAQ